MVELDNFSIDAILPGNEDDPVLQAAEEAGIFTTQSDLGFI
jgi:hypothetical protein